MDKELLERHAVLQSPARINELVKIFIHATKVRTVSLPSIGKSQFADMVSGCKDGDCILGNV